MAYYGNYLKVFVKNYGDIFIRNYHASSSFFGKIIPFNLSDIGEGIREVSVKEWYIKEGDRVSQFDNICEVQSDKASVTITSRYDGIIKKIHYKTDEIALVGKPLIDIETEEAETVNKNVIQEEQPNKPVELIKNVQTDDYSLCIPSVRRLARQYKLDLTKIKGTGHRSRILKEDVLKYLKNKDDTVTQNDVTTYKLNNFQKAMFKTMTDSLKIPHFVYTEEIKITKLNKLRKELNESNTELKLTIVPFFIKAISLALNEYPILNSILTNDESVTLKKEHNIGIAMDTKNGLAVPVIKNVEKLKILDISNELKRLLKNGKDGNFALNDLKDGTFTFSNIGTIGGIHASPVILTPQVGIIAIGKIQLLPRFNNELKVVPEEIINISGSGDHRIIDGATMSKFINIVKHLLENPNLLMLK